MKWTKVLKAAAAAVVIGGAVLAAGCGGDDAAKETKAAAGAKTYVVATRGTSNPYSYTDEAGNLTGYDVEILKEIEKRDPTLHFEFKTMAIDAAFVSMDAGQVDIIANQMRRSPAREAKYLFTNEVNNYSVRRLAVREDSDIKSLDDLRGKKVAVTTNSEFKEIVEKYNETADPKIEIIFSDKASAETLNLVATKRADAAGEYVYITERAKKDRGLPVKAAGDVLAVVPTYFVIRKSDEGAEAVKKLDKALADMKSDGSLAALSKKFLGDDYTKEPAK